MPVCCVPPGYYARLQSLDTDVLFSMQGVISVVQNGSFIAVVGESEIAAIRAIEKAQEIGIWLYEKNIPPQQSLYDDLISKPAHSNLIVNGTATDDPITPIQAPDNAQHTITATYQRPYHMHGSLGPSAAVALWGK